MLTVRRSSEVLTVAVPIIAAVAAAAGAVLAAPFILGRDLSTLELVLLVFAFALFGWALASTLRRRERKRILGMRDSALW